MALSTKDLQGSASVKKTIAPGNHTLKINSVKLEPFKFIENAYHLMLHLETEPIDGFEGFLVDPENPENGYYKGQVGKVKANRYAYADGETKSGIKVERDRSILMFLKTLCKALDTASDSELFTKWFSAQDGEHETIEEFVTAFDTEIKKHNTYLDFCVAGKEYENKNGYINYDMFLARTSRGNYAFGEKGSKKVISYDEKHHLIKLPVKNVESFGDEDISIPSNTSNYFSLD